jgi:hypothetical protein
MKFLTIAITSALCSSACSIFFRERLAVGLACISIIVLAIIWVNMIKTRSGYSDLHRALALIIVVVFSVVVAVTNWPLKLTFSLVEDDIEALAQRVDAGERIEYPQRVGVFTIYGAGIRSGTVYLITSPSGHDWEVEGLARHAEGEGFNLWSSTSLGDKWSYVSED